MTTAALLLATIGACAAVVWLITVFMQFLFYSAACSGCGIALLQIAGMPDPNNWTYFAMAALMGVIVIGIFHVFKSWGTAIKRMRLA